ncbi:hypothetical protein CR513_09001, partial [Mucuna pruriens]
MFKGVFDHSSCNGIMFIVDELGTNIIKDKVVNRNHIHNKSQDQILSLVCVFLSSQYFYIISCTLRLLKSNLDIN